MHSTPWEATTQELYGKLMVTPRLVARWSSPEDIETLPPVIERMRQLLVTRYRRPFDSVGANLYRDGRDSVAWHGDHIPLRIINPVVATVSLGSPRRFVMRPREGRTALTLALGMGDLVVMGGRSQRTWLHAVPKVASAGPRISVAYRHSTDSLVCGLRALARHSARAARQVVRVRIVVSQRCRHVPRGRIAPVRWR